MPRTCMHTACTCALCALQVPDLFMGLEPQPKPEPQPEPEPNPNPNPRQVPDLFMRRVERGAVWSFFAPTGAYPYPYPPTP